jgi:hypothetical protein
VKLTYRLPILAVEVPPDLAAKQPDSPAKPTLRAVDEHSIVLPKKANLQGLVILRGVPRPAGGAGQPWGDSGVAVAASTAAYLKPHLSTLGLNAMTWTEENLILWRADIKAIWGGGPSAEKKTQAPTAIKKRRLLEAVAHAPPIPAWLPVMHEFDVRPLDGLGHRFVRREAPP